MKSSNTPHLDPLPSADEGRGRPIALVRRTSVWVNERGRIFPLPFRRGEDQGENSPIQIAQCAPEPGKSADVDYQWLANTVHGQGLIPADYCLLNSKFRPCNEIQRAA